MLVIRGLTSLFPMVSNPDGTTCSQSQHVRQYEISCFAQFAFNNDLLSALVHFVRVLGNHGMVDHALLTLLRVVVLHR